MLFSRRMVAARLMPFHAVLRGISLPFVSHLRVAGIAIAVCSLAAGIHADVTMEIILNINLHHTSVLVCG